MLILYQLGIDHRRFSFSFRAQKSREVSESGNILGLCDIGDTLSPMSQSAVIHARIDPSTKEATERILESLGLTPTEGIRLFYRQIAMRGEFPLELHVPNSLTAGTLEMADRGEALEAFPSVDDLYASWDS